MVSAFKAELTMGLTDNFELLLSREAICERKGSGVRKEWAPDELHGIRARFSIGICTFSLQTFVSENVVKKDVIRSSFGK